jgi:uncharacterized membrane protein YeaQ/YmgE (transglycosylase-associated protein family)
MRIPICDPNESLRIVSRGRMREGLEVVTTTSTLDFAVRLLDVDRSLLKMDLPTREQIARECAAIRKKWSPAERARRWRGRSTQRRYE